ncbi:hypothetical protein B0T26DRAFT_152079 [Lasiosphaeria miniovina]|uniref:Uncharacterized protein n=1 Tax=Lasiosphaeria miniovina TaxID=1954250 RepID=A0AA40EA53_9PEZI|nr:uncharacterized protein B0T26DRAFT_152079 [Lasiosphaeria miniovina]KAK0727968.1 hypothetical protein B0T26DRAFT_152079 [Lasiosphaeria miniovina]
MRWLLTLIVSQAFIKWIKTWIGNELFDRIPKEEKMLTSPLLVTFLGAITSFTGEDEIRTPLPAECGVIDDFALDIKQRVLTISA